LQQYLSPSLQRGYSLSEIQSGAYRAKSQYPDPILDWSLTRKVNGKIVSDLHKTMKERLVVEGGQEYDGVAIPKKTVDQYWDKDKQYRECKHKSQVLSTDGDRFV
jgi:deoxyribodipyrimidine photo-lyase